MSTTTKKKSVREYLQFRSEMGEKKKGEESNRPNAIPKTPQTIPITTFLKNTIQTTTTRQPSRQPGKQPTFPTTTTPLIRIIPPRRRGSLLIIHPLLLLSLRRIPSSVVPSLRRRRTVRIRALCVWVRRAAAVVAWWRWWALVVVAYLSRWWCAVWGRAGVLVYGGWVGGGCAGGRGEVLFSGHCLRICGESRSLRGSVMGDVEDSRRLFESRRSVLSSLSFLFLLFFVRL